MDLGDCALFEEVQLDQVLLVRRLLPLLLLEVESQLVLFLADLDIFEKIIIYYRKNKEKDII